MPQVQGREPKELELCLCRDRWGSGMTGAPAGRKLDELGPVPHVSGAPPRNWGPLVWVSLMPNRPSENGKTIPVAKWTPFHSFMWELGSRAPGLMNLSRKMNSIVVFPSFSFRDGVVV